ncbi:hypothetical protein [Nocardia sp. NPDC049526]|uniref:hypothetical protein n=1 Tax=Nocardia sp. NPDC049526 TaxID=3364316 RepID=UPI0037AA8C70
MPGRAGGKRVGSEIRYEPGQFTAQLLKVDSGRFDTDNTVARLGTSDQPRQCLLMYPQGVVNGRGPDGCPAGTKSDTEVWTPPDR